MNNKILKRFALKSKPKRGSVLAYSLIVISAMLAIAATLSTVTILEKKGASGTEFSAQSLQSADSGAQLAIKKINEALIASPDTIAAALLSLNLSCSGGNKFVSDPLSGNPIDSYYELTFFDDATPAVKLNCDADVLDVAKIMSSGIYKDTLRSVGVSLDSSLCGNNIADSTVPTIIYNGVLAKDGKCWLDRNLGATEVATTTTGHINGYDDDAAYGWLFQWGRPADGHQYTAWGGQPSPSLSSIASISSSASVSVPAPNTNKFIVNVPGDWLSPQDGTLWKGINGGATNPCPTGFRIPTQSEWAALVTAEAITGGATGFSSNLKLTAAGTRLGSDASLYQQGAQAYYWSSTTNGDNSVTLFYSVPGMLNDNHSLGRSNGISVRCIKE